MIYKLYNHKDILITHVHKTEYAFHKNLKVLQHRSNLFKFLGIKTFIPHIVLYKETKLSLEPYSNSFSGFFFCIFACAVTYFFFNKWHVFDNWFWLKETFLDQFTHKLLPSTCGAREYYQYRQNRHYQNLWKYTCHC